MAETDRRVAAMVGSWESRGFRVTFKREAGRMGCRVETPEGELAGWSWAPLIQKHRMRPEADVKAECLRKATWRLSRERTYG